MGRLNNTEFLAKVTDVLTSNEGKSSVYFTQKRLSLTLEPATPNNINDLSSNVVDHPKEFPTNTTSYPVLIRFTLGDKKSKVSTVIEPEDLDKFWSEYAQILKTGFVGLKKKEKKKAKKSKVSKN